jgi:hypothetical protein
MGCHDPDTGVPPAADFAILGSTDPRILQAIKDAAEPLKQAGVSKVDILDLGNDSPVHIIPMGGSRLDVNKTLDAIREALQTVGFQAHEGPAFRCPNSSLELRVSRPSPSR